VVARFYVGSDSECAPNFVQISEKVEQAMIRQASGEESMSCTRKVQTCQDWKGEMGRAKSRACLSFSLSSSPSIIRIIKSRRIRCAGNVARMGGEEKRL
jgi:hypothetical protein